MSDSKFVDFHTHTKNSSSEITRLNSLSLKDTQNIKPENTFVNPFTIGVHPWDVDDLIEMDFKFKLTPYLKNTKCVGLGEMGLDRARMQNYDTQIKVFTEQVKWAVEQNIDFIVLHCVRAQNEILKILKDCKYQGTAVFHDYNGSIEDWLQLQEKGYIVSLGVKIFDSKTKAAKLVQSWQENGEWPWGQAFLETDDHHGEEIFKLYEQVSKIMKIPVSELKARFISSLPQAMQKL